MRVQRRECFLKDFSRRGGVTGWLWPGNASARNVVLHPGRDGGGPPRSGQRLPGPRAERRKAEGETPAGAFNIGTKATGAPEVLIFS